MKRPYRHGRRHVHDDAGLPLPKLRQHCLRHGDRAERVGLEDIADRLHRRALDGVQEADARVVDQDVDWTGSLNGPTDALRVGDVQRNDAQVLRTRQDVFTRASHRGDHLPAAIEEVAGDLETEAGRASGDQCGLHDVSPWACDRRKVDLLCRIIYNRKSIYRLRKSGNGQPW